MKADVSLVSCKSYDRTLIQEATRRAIEIIGGITSFIKPQSRVLLKPNLLLAKGPESGIITHPEIVRAVAHILKEIGCELFLGDGPSVWAGQSENIEGVWEATGMRKLCQEEGIKLVAFEKKHWRERFPLTAWLTDCDYLISLPKFKTHGLTILSGAIKNLFGLVPGTFKTEIHKNNFKLNDFSNILVDIYQEARPALTVVDGVMAMEGEGPATSGRLRQAGVLLASSDCVALDTILAKIMGIDPLEVLTTKIAVARGLGAADISSISVKGERIEDVLAKPFLLPKPSLNDKLPKFLINIAKKTIRYYPCLDQNNCTGCEICIATCPNKVISMKGQNLHFNYSRCIACFCCQEACPSSAIRIKKSLFAKFIGL